MKILITENQLTALREALSDEWTDKTYVVRYSNHIHDDIQRNWSSFSFGGDGFEGTKEQLDAAIAATTDRSPLLISGFELFADDIKRTTFGELYDNYWVVIDDTRGDGLSCNILDAETLEEAIDIVTAPGFQIEMGYGDTVDCSDAKVVWSNPDGDTHILEIER